MTLRSKQAIFWMMVADTIKFADSQATPIVPLCIWRSEQEQEALVAKKASKTMKSKHLEGLALDFVFLGDLQDDGVINWDKVNPQYYRIIGQFWENLGGRWGGRFGDDPNTEKIEGWDQGHLEYMEGT